MLRICIPMLSIGITLFAATAPSQAQVTRGEVADRNAAYDVIRCAQGYIKRGASGMSERDIWQMCLEVVTENARRQPSNVRPHVNKIAKKNVL